MPSSPIRTKLLWDFGTAYDLFLSLHVLHNPDVFGLKPSWAAGVRSRLPVEQRQTLELALNVMATPFYFVHGLPKPKSSGVVIEAISKIPASMRLPALYFRASSPINLREILQGTTAQIKWTRVEKNVIIEAFKSRDLDSQPTILDQLHHVWSHRDEFGEAYLAALTSYCLLYTSPSPRD